MIDAKDLKCNNYLQYYIGEEGCEWEFTKIDAQDILWCESKNENFNKVHKPIPITEEWLKNFGFQDANNTKEETKNPTLGYWLSWHIEIEKEDIRIDKNKKDVTRYFITLAKWEKEECFIYSRGYMNIRIKHVHQLQNLYFALTGKELQVLNL